MASSEEITFVIEAAKLIISIGKEAYKKFLDNITEQDVIWVPLIIPPTWPETERFFELRMPELIKKGGDYYKHWRTRNSKSESRVALIRVYENFVRAEKFLPYIENNPQLKEIFKNFPDEKLRIVASLFKITEMHEKNESFNKILDTILDKITKKPGLLNDDNKLAKTIKDVLNEFKESK